MSDFRGRLEGYVEVHERIKTFKEAHPEGSLQGSYEVVDVNGSPLIVYCAKAYRTPDDKRPGVGYASEPVPGHTPYTKDSELMNAETSAWGRAIGALGFEVHSGVASANEVRARNGGEAAKGFVSDKQRAFFERLLKDAGAKPATAARICAYAAENLTGGRDGEISEAIDGLKEEESRKSTAKVLAASAAEWEKSLDAPIPADTEGLA